MVVQLLMLVVPEAVPGHAAGRGGVHVPRRAVGRGQGAAGFGDEQGTGGDVPGSGAEVDVGI